MLEVRACWRILWLSIVEDISDQIGERLTKARETAGLTVEDVMFKTRIPRSVINALEAGDFSVFSSPTYAKSFLSQYSSFLNVDARLWLDALVPAAFIAGEIVLPLWEAANPARDEPVSSPRESTTTGWASALTMMAATGMLVFVALKGYEFFEKRFGLELAAPETTTVSPVAPQPAVVPPAPVAKPETAARKAGEDPPPPPPRAIIVR